MRFDGRMKPVLAQLAGGGPGVGDGAEAAADVGTADGAAADPPRHAMRVRNEGDEASSLEAEGECGEAVVSPRERTTTDGGGT